MFGQDSPSVLDELEQHRKLHGYFEEFDGYATEQLRLWDGAPTLSTPRGDVTHPVRIPSNSPDEDMHMDDGYVTEREHSPSDDRADNTSSDEDVQMHDNELPIMPPPQQPFEEHEAEPLHVLSDSSVEQSNGGDVQMHDDELPTIQPRQQPLEDDIAEPVHAPPESAAEDMNDRDVQMDGVDSKLPSPDESSDNESSDNESSDNESPTDDVNMSDKDEVTVEVGCSDADTTHAPFEHEHNAYLAPPKVIDKWVTALENLWEKDGGDADQEVGFPEGYRLYALPRTYNDRVEDKMLFGHPGHHRFRSPNEFFPHFKYLIEKAQGGTEACPCKYCGKPSKNPVPAVRPGAKLFPNLRKG